MYQDLTWKMKERRLTRDKFFDADGKPRVSMRIFDTETDGLYDEATKLHCIVIKDYFTNEVFRCYENPSEGDYSIEWGLNCLESSDYLVAHNGINFDLPVLEKLYPKFRFAGKSIDTLVYSRMVFRSLAAFDHSDISKGKLNADDFVVWDKDTQSWVSAVGRHSLGAWGLRLGNKKSDYGNTADWSTFTPEMLEYCVQDVEVLHQLLDTLFNKKYPIEPLRLEFQVADIITRQCYRGWEFDDEAAHNIYAELSARKHDITTKLREAFPSYEEVTKTPEYYAIKIPHGYYQKATKGEVIAQAWADIKERGIKYKKTAIEEACVAGPLKVKIIDFSPASPFHVYEAMNKKYGWKPKLWNKNGSPQINEGVLSKLEYPEAKLLLDYEIVKDRLEKLAEGKNGGYITYSKNGRIRHYCNPIGAATYRATHNSPNLAQVPSLGDPDDPTPYGAEFRALFKARKGFVLVGTDASAQELCCLAHYMYPYDKGAYGKVVVEGKKEDGTDVHTVNQKAAGLPSRANAKTFIYGFLYGAGDDKIGKIVGKGKKEGTELRSRFLKGLPALAKLKLAVEKQALEWKSVMTLDGRSVSIRSEHAALNFLLQSTGAILTKKWMCIIDEGVRARGWSDKVFQVGWIHDELQFEVLEEIAEEFGLVCQESMTKVEKYYDFKCKLLADYKIAKDWSGTH